MLVQEISETRKRRPERVRLLANSRLLSTAAFGFSSRRLLYSILVVCVISIFSVLHVKKISSTSTHCLYCSRDDEAPIAKNGDVFREQYRNRHHRSFAIEHWKKYNKSGKPIGGVDYGFENVTVQLGRKQVPSVLASSMLAVQVLPPIDPVDAELLWRGNGGRFVSVDRSAVNPSILKFQDVYYVATREHYRANDRSWFSQILFANLSRYEPAVSPPRLSGPSVRLQPNLQLPSAVRRCFLRQPGHFISGPRDPRLFAHNNSLWVSFLYYADRQAFKWNSPCSELTSFEQATWVFDIRRKSKPLELKADSRTRLRRRPPFLFEMGSPDDVELFTITSIEPHVLSQVDSTTGIVHEVARTSSIYLFKHIPLFEQLQLNAAPVRIAFDYITQEEFLRGKADYKILREHSTYMLGTFHVVLHQRITMHYFYLFAETYPYEVMCVGAYSLHPPKVDHVSSATTIELSDDLQTVTVWFGNMDGGYASHFDMKSVLSTLNCQESSEMFRSLDSYSVANRQAWLSDKTNVDISLQGESSSWDPLRGHDGIIFPIRYDNALRESVGFFNPSILALPYGSKYPFVAVARILHVQGSRKDPTTGATKDILHSRMVACVMDADFCCVGIHQELDLPVPVDKADRRLFSEKDPKRDLGYDRYYGPEDGRLAWESKSWQVFLVYGMNADNQPGMDRNMWIVDLAQVYPYLNDVLPEDPDGLVPAQSKRFSMPTEIVYAEAKGFIQKNWVPFLHNGRVLISYSLFPKVVLDVSNFGIAKKVFDTGFSKHFKAINPEQYRVHQGSGAIRVRLCNFGNCTSSAPEVYATIFHRRSHNDPDYRHFLVVFEGYPPFDVIHLSEMNDLEAYFAKKAKVSKFIFVMSLDFVRFDRNMRIISLKDQAVDPDMAFLDSTAVVGLGADDSLSYVYLAKMKVLLGEYLNISSS